MKFNFWSVFKESTGEWSMRRLLAFVFGVVTAIILLAMAATPTGLAIGIAPAIISAALTLGLLFWTTIEGLINKKNG